MEQIEIFIIDDHPLYIEGIKRSFDKKTDHIFVGGWATSIAEAREKLKTSLADVILLDLVLPGESGVDFCIELKRDYPDKKVIALTGESDEELLHNVWINKVDAIIMKVIGKKYLISTIKATLSGERKIGPNVPPFFDHHDSSRNKPFLTRREQQVMHLLICGDYRKEVAEKLNISLDTVNKHCNNVFKKFDVDSLQKYIRKAKKLKIIG